MSASLTSSTGCINVFWHEGMLSHDTGHGVFDTGIDPGLFEVLEKHPENSDRVKNMVSILKKGPISPYISWHSGRPATVPDLLTFHSQGTLFSFNNIIFFTDFIYFCYNCFGIEQDAKNLGMGCQILEQDFIF